MKLSPKWLKFFLNIYGPHLGAGITVTHISADWREIRVAMKLRWYNRNIVGTHFGGSLYSMVDPHYMILLMNLLGKEYIVWDKSAHIDFVKASKKPVHAVFRIPKEDENRIREKTENGEKYLPEFQVQILDSEETVIAVINKQLYVRKKRSAIRTLPPK